MKTVTNVLSIIQSVGILIGVRLTIWLASNSMLYGYSLWILNVIATLLSVIIFALSKNYYNKLALINYLAISILSIANIIEARKMNISYLLFYNDVIEIVYFIVLLVSLIINALLAIRFIIMCKK